MVLAVFGVLFCRYVVDSENPEISREKSLEDVT